MQHQGSSLHSHKNWQTFLTFQSFFCTNIVSNFNLRCPKYSCQQVSNQLWVDQNRKKLFVSAIMYYTCIWICINRNCQRFSFLSINIIIKAQNTMTCDLMSSVFFWMPASAKKADLILSTWPPRRVPQLQLMRLILGLKCATNMSNDRLFWVAA